MGTGKYTDVQGQLGGDSSLRLPLSRGVLTAISPDFRAEALFHWLIPRASKHPQSSRAPGLLTWRASRPRTPDPARMPPTS